MSYTKGNKSVFIDRVIHNGMYIVICRRGAEVVRRTMHDTRASAMYAKNAYMSIGA